MMMNIDVEYPQSGHVVVRPHGRVDADSAQSLKEKLREIAQTGAEYVVVDLHAVDFIDSSGLSALVSGLKALRQHGGVLNLSQPQTQALTALRLTMLDRVFPIFTSVEEALNEGDLLKP
jgi:anti-anti-sigma factor